MRNISEERLLRNFGGRLAAARKQRGVTQEELAETVRVSVNTISNIENGNRWVRITTLYKLAAALEIETKELF